MVPASFRRTLTAAAVASALGVTAPRPLHAEPPAILGYYLRLEGGRVDATSDSTAYAEIVSTPPGLQTGLLRLAPDDGWSGRVEFGARLSNDWDLGVRYSRLEVDDDAANTGITYPRYAYPVLGTATTFYDSVVAKAEVSYHVVDFEAGHHVKLGGADLRLAAGLRYVDLDQDFSTRFDLSGTTFTANEYLDVDYRGIGPRLSAALSGPLSDWGLRVGGAVGGAVLLGRIDRSRLQVGIPPFLPVNASKGGKNRTAYILDAEVHLSYERALGGDDSFAVAVGYRGEAWLGVNDTTNRTSPTGARYGASDADQRFNGPFLRMSYSF